MSEHLGNPTPEQVAADLTNVVGRFVRRLRGVSPGSGLSPTQRSVLARLDREGPASGIPARVIGSHCRVRAGPSSAGVTVNALPGAGDCRPGACHLLWESCE
ncbi:hypothetical protein ABZS76_02775 [Streptomyces sp. NPDC005562]|uniref:hypothetical protein n=1 Tax=Streptomyces sp. NPDC005562 TaxID=3154890 RepID=UPI0033B9F047